MLKGCLKVKVCRCTRNVNISHTGCLDCYTKVVVSTILCVSLFRKIKICIIIWITVEFGYSTLGHVKFFWSYSCLKMTNSLGFFVFFWKPKWNGNDIEMAKCIIWAQDNKMKILVHLNSQKVYRSLDGEDIERRSF